MAARRGNQRALIAQALLIAEQAAQSDADDALRLARRLGITEHDKVIAARIKSANTLARQFDALRRELEAETEQKPGKKPRRKVKK